MSALARTKISRLAVNSAVLLVCDVQDRFRSLIHNSKTVVSKCAFLNEAAKIFDIPVVITEQYPEKLGKTVPDIAIHPSTKVFSKAKFSMLTTEVQAELESLGRNQVLLSASIISLLFDIHLSGIVFDYSSFFIGNSLDYSMRH